MDASASQEQAGKLGALFSGQLGGPPEAFAGLIGENLGVEIVPKEYADYGRRHRVQIGDFAEIEVEDFVPPQRPQGEVYKLTNILHFVNSTLTIGRATTSRSTHSGRSSPTRGSTRNRRPFPGRRREDNMERSSTFAPTILQRWTHRENLLPGLALATAGWVYVAYQSSSMGSMAIEGTGGGVVFLSGWTAIDCLDCCAGLMVGLVALGMMNLAWMLTAAAVILVDKTIPGSHRIARFLGVLMVVGGVGLLGASLLSGVAAQMEPV